MRGLCWHSTRTWQVACPVGMRGGQGRRTPQSFLRWSVILHSCSFLAARGGGNHAAQGRAGQGGGGVRVKEKQQAAPEGRAGWTGSGVAPGVRHDPVFGSPGEEFPPLHPCPATLPTRPPDQHIQFLEPGAPPGVPETRRGLGHPTQCCRGVEGQGQALPKDKAGRGWVRACPRQRMGREPQSQELAPTKAWMGVAPRDSCFLLGVGWSPSPSSVAQGLTK